MSLHPDIKSFLSPLISNRFSDIEFTYKQIREQTREKEDAKLANIEPVVFRVEDLIVPGPEGSIPIRIYTPGEKGPFPLLVFFHGGGWVLGSIQTHDIICRKLCLVSSHKVVSVDYRLAPGHPFPAAVEDCYAATKWVCDHIKELQGDAARISVAGDSAGGNLAAAVALISRDRGGPLLSKQVLLYPATDYCDGNNSPYTSYEINKSGYYLTKKGMGGFWKLYVTEQKNQNNPYVSPIRAVDLRDLPSALILTAEYDPLRDEGEAYGKRLERSGVPVTMKRYIGLIHGFLGMSDIEPIQDSFNMIGRFLKGN